MKERSRYRVSAPDLPRFGGRRNRRDSTPNCAMSATNLRDDIFIWRGRDSFTIFWDYSVLSQYAAHGRSELGGTSRSELEGGWKGLSSLATHDPTTRTRTRALKGWDDGIPDLQKCQDGFTLYPTAILSLP